MRTHYLHHIHRMAVTMAVGLAGATGAAWAVAQESSPATSSPPAAAQPAVSAPTPQAAVASQNPPPLSYGVGEVMKLMKAKISDPTILAYIQNSRTTYDLSAGEIVYLKQQGVSDAVLTAMLSERGGPVIAAQSTSSPNNTEASTVPMVTTASTAYVTQAPPSPVYVVSDPPVYYDYYPDYGYYGWPFPGLAFSFGWGGHFGGYHGGGGGFHGGGFHSGGGGFRGGGGHR